MTVQQGSLAVAWSTHHYCYWVRLVEGGWGQEFAVVVGAMVRRQGHHSGGGREGEEEAATAWGW